jgi:hypothetical protein
MNLYCITDSYGTRQWAWGRRQALEWLAAASPDAQVRNLWGKLVAERKQARVY